MRRVLVPFLLLSPTTLHANPFIAEGRTPAELLAEVASSCMDFGDNITESSNSMVVCEAPAPNTPGASFLGSLMFGTGADKIKTVYRFVALPHPAGTRLRVQITLEADQGHGSVKRVDRTGDWKKMMPKTIAMLRLIPENEFQPSAPPAR